MCVCVCQKFYWCGRKQLKKLTSVCFMDHWQRSILNSTESLPALTSENFHLTWPGIKNRGIPVCRHHFSEFGLLWVVPEPASPHARLVKKMMISTRMEFLISGEVQRKIEFVFLVFLCPAGRGKYHITHQISCFFLNKALLLSVGLLQVDLSS